MKKNIVALVPARGGSKRFPGKNIYPLNGRPLLSYPVKAALDAKKVDRVIVTTDDEEIAAVAKFYGAEVPFLRPREISEDNSSIVGVMLHALNYLKEAENYQVDYLIMLQPTNPLVYNEQIDKAIELALRKKADSVVSVALVDTPSNPHNIRVVDKHMKMKFWMEIEHYKGMGKKRPVFYKAANLWLSSYNALVNHHRIEGKNNYALAVDPVCALDIDYKEDLELIEAWLQYQDRKQ